MTIDLRDTLAGVLIHAGHGIADAYDAADAALASIAAADPCRGLHLHYTGYDGANVWTAYDGPHALMGPGLFTAEHSAVRAYIEDRRS